MAQRVVVRAALGLLVLLACLSPLAIACGPGYPVATFISEHPDLPLDEYAAGNLGIVVPSYKPSYLAVAYRYFENHPFDADEQIQLVGAWDARLHGYAVGSNTSPAANAGPVFDANGGGLGNFEEIPNCLQDAFETAEKTREDRIRQFGADSAAVASWLEAQKTVFTNCADTTAPKVPGAADPSLPLIIRKDRDYQIAAAYFYATKFEEAKRRFINIAKDADSPWRATAALVAARCDIRAATLGTDDPVERKQRLAAADQQLKAVIANPTFSSMKVGAQRLHGFVGYRLDPNARANEIAEAIAQDSEPGAIGANIMDFDRLGARAASDDLSDWIRSFQFSGAGGGQDHRVMRWEQTQSPAWLAAALTYAQPGDAKSAELLDAAAKIPAASPAYLTVAFHRNRLLAFGGRQAEARNNLDTVLRMPKEQVSASSRNLFVALRMQAARNLDEFLQFAPRQPIGVTYDLEHNDPQLCDLSNCIEAPSQLFDSDAAVVFTEAMPTSELVQAGANTRLPDNLRTEVAAAAWTRAVLLNQDGPARQLAIALSSLAPDIELQLTAYGAERSPEERRFAAEFLILKAPGMVPYVSAGMSRYEERPYEGEKPTPRTAINSYRLNWWCTFGPAPPPGTPSSPGIMNTGMQRQRMNVQFSGGLGLLYPGGKAIPPLYLTQGEKDAAAQEWASLLHVPAAADWLGQQILSWAKTHPDDPRVPEALHRVVVASRYGCNDTDTGTYSKQAFTVLHSKYPKSEWAAQTPYWFN